MAMSERFGAATVRSYTGGKRIRDKLWSMLASGAFREFGSKSVIALPVRLVGAGRMSIGHRVYVGPGSWLQCIGGEDQPGLAIGDDTKIAGACVVSAADDVRIGSGVLVASNVYIADHSHAFDEADVPVNEQGIDRIAAVRIEDDCWIGQNVVIMPGVTIGRGAVIGSNSVVTADVPGRTVAVGAPARVVRQIGDES